MPPLQDLDEERLARLEILLEQLQRQHAADPEVRIRIDDELERVRVERRVLFDRRHSGSSKLPAA